MRKLILTLLAVILALTLAVPALAVPAFGGPITQVQPDGTEIKVRMHGDENSGATYTDMSDNVILMDKENTWRYVVLNGDSFGLGSTVSPDAPGDNASYVTLDQLALEGGMEKMNALKVAIPTLTQTGVQQQAESKTNVTLIIVGVVAVVVIAAVAIWLVKKRGK